MPFVTVSPYLHSLSFGERFLISLGLTVLIMICFWIAGEKADRQLLDPRKGKQKDVLLLFGGALLFTWIPAYFGGNVLGGFVNGFEGRPSISTLKVHEVDERTRKFARVMLVLECDRTGQRFGLTLSDAAFDYPTIRPSQYLTVRSKTNSFGTYVESVEFEPGTIYGC